MSFILKMQLKVTSARMPAILYGADELKYMCIFE